MRLATNRQSPQVESDQAHVDNWSARSKPMKERKWMAIYRSLLDLSRREQKLVKFERRREKCHRIGAKESQMLLDLSG